MTPFKIALGTAALFSIGSLASATPVTIDANTLTPVGVTASSYIGVLTVGGNFLTDLDRSPVHTIDSSGLTGNQHASGSANGIMWTSTGSGIIAPTIDPIAADYSPTITFDLGAVYNVSAMDIWNYNEDVSGNQKLGAKTVQVQSSIDGTLFANVGSPITFAEAPGTGGYTGDEMTFSITGARYVRFEILDNYDGATFTGAANGSNGGTDGRYLTGLSEVRFEVPEPASLSILGLAGIGLLARRRR